MHILKLDLKERAYNIIIGYNVISLLGAYVRKLDIGHNAYIVTNAYLKHKYGAVLTKALKRHNLSVKFKLIPATERSKSLGVAFAIAEDIAKYDNKRHIFILAFGGGVVGDVAGFIASIYKRGTAYIQIPTTLLSQVDSSIGGKTAVDLKQGKNLLGTFYQPRLVLSDINFIKTLDTRQLRSGLAEVIKYGIIKDPYLFSYIEEEHEGIFALKEPVLEFIIWRCSRIKAEIVRKDERDKKGIRAILNFGHTLGHAIEAASDYRRYGHGEAVALGMLLASDISESLGLVSNTVARRIEDIIKTVGLPTRLNRLSVSDVIAAYYRDKKFIGPTNKFILIKSIGVTKVVEDVPLTVVKNALRKRLQTIL